MSSLAEQKNLEWLERPMRSGDAAAIRFSPSDPEIVYLGIEVNRHSLYRSADGGRSWNRIHSFDHAKDLAVHPTNPDIVFLNESHYVWRTSTDDANGSALAGLLAATNRQFREGTAFSQVLESPYGFGPDSTSWSSVEISLSDPDVVYVSMKGSRPYEGAGGNVETTQALYRSNNGGLSFDQIDGTFPVINVLFIHPSEPDILLLGSYDGLYRSIDAGRSFTRVSEQWRFPDVVDIDSLDGNLMFAATSRGVVRSGDGGATWDHPSQTISDHSVFRVQIARSDPNIIWATTSKGVYRSIDGGLNWNEALGDLPVTNLQALAVHPRNPEIVLVSTETFNFSVRSPHSYAPGQYYGQGIYRTDNGGTTWVRTDSGIIEDEVMALTAHPTRPYEIWGGSDASRGLYRTRDAGQSWSLSPSWLNHYPMQMAFFPDRPDAFVVTGSHSNQDFGVSIDSGVNWFTLSERAFLDAISFDKDRFVQKDIRGGNVHLHAVAVDPSNPRIVYVGSIHDPSSYAPKPLSGSHIFKSYDAGVTWEEVGENYPREIETAVRVIVVDPHNTDVIYLGTSEKESVVGNGLWISADAGRTWAQSNDGMPGDASINAVVVHPSNAGWLLAGTQQGMYRSSDAAATWHRVSDWVVWDVEVNPQHPSNVYVGAQQGLMVSSDFGETWKHVSPDQLSGPIMAVAVNCNGTAVYVSDGERGVRVALAEPAASIPRDTTKGVEYGKFTSRDVASRGSKPDDREQSSGPTAAQVECMIHVLGEDVVAQFGPGGRPVSQDEEALIQHCGRMP